MQTVLLHRRQFLHRSVVAAGLVCGILASTTFAADTPKPRILILGDSISIGYTPFVQELLKNEAVVVRPMANEKQAENCEGTTKGVEAVERWLKLQGGHWDVIHFNFGLHDLKQVDPVTKKNSNEATGVHQADPDVYERQLRQIVAALKKTNARLIYALTTPVPNGGVKPYRDVLDPLRYNEIALRVMEQNGVAVNDLYAVALPRLKEIQQPINVHFTKQGSQLLAEAVVASIRGALARPVN